MKAALVRAHTPVRHGVCLPLPLVRLAAAAAAPAAALPLPLPVAALAPRRATPARQHQTCNRGGNMQQCRSIHMIHSSSPLHSSLSDPAPPLPPSSSSSSSSPRRRTPRAQLRHEDPEQANMVDAMTKVFVKHKQPRRFRAEDADRRLGWRAADLAPLQRDMREVRTRGD